MKVALYARRSKPPKDYVPKFKGDEGAGSTQAQLARLEAWAAGNGHQVVMAEPDTASGRNPNRPGWQRVMAAVRGGHVQAVAVTKTSRCMRNVKHYLEAVDEFLKRGCQFLVLDQPAASVLGKADPMASAFRTVAAAFSQLELDLAREASMEVLERREDGRLYGPRSDLPAGRPREFGPEHRFRLRGGARVHDRARCRACGESGGSPASGVWSDDSVGVAEPGGFATPGGLAQRHESQEVEAHESPSVREGANPVASETRGSVSDKPAGVNGA